MYYYICVIIIKKKHFNSHLVLDHDLCSGLESFVRIFRVVPIDKNHSSEIRGQAERPHVEQLLPRYGRDLAGDMPYVE